MKIFSVLSMIFLAGCSVNYQNNSNATITTQTTVYESKQAMQKLQAAVNLAIPDIDYNINELITPRECRPSYIKYSMQKLAIESGLQKTLTEETATLFYNSYYEFRLCIKNNTTSI
jgi:hypothetical protein